MTNNILRTVRDYATTHAPAILTGLGVAGLASSIFLTAQATPKALKDIYHHEAETGEETTWQEKIQLTWRYYVPTASVAVLSAASIIGAQSLNRRRQAALMSVYALTETAFREYRDKNVELYGEKHHEKVLDSVAEDKINENPPRNSEIIVTGSGDHLCYDSLTGRYFRSDIETIRKAVNDVNAICLTDTYASQNDFYARIGLDPVAFGEENGWRFDHLMDVHFSSHLSEENGAPALALMYDLSPIRGYYKINR